LRSKRFVSGSKKTRRGFDSGTRAGSGNALVDADSKADVFQQENGIYERGWIAKSAGSLRAYYCRFGLVSLRENWKHVLFVERGKSDTTQYCMLVCVGAQGILIFVEIMSSHVHHPRCICLCVEVCACFSCVAGAVALRTLPWERTLIYEHRSSRSKHKAARLEKCLLAQCATGSAA